MASTHNRRPYDRPLHARMAGMVQVWAVILGLCVMMVAWALIAWAAIGSGTQLDPNYNLLGTTPAQQAYITLREYQRPRR